MKRTAANFCDSEKFMSLAEMNLNTGKSWSEMDLADLKNCIARREPIEEIADFLCRDIEEVRIKIREIEPQYPGLTQ